MVPLLAQGEAQGEAGGQVAGLIQGRAVSRSSSSSNISRSSKPAAQPQGASSERRAVQRRLKVVVALAAEHEAHGAGNLGGARVWRCRRPPPPDAGRWKPLADEPTRSGSVVRPGARPRIWGSCPAAGPRSPRAPSSRANVGLSSGSCSTASARRSTSRTVRSAPSREPAMRTSLEGSSGFRR